MRRTRLFSAGESLLELSGMRGKVIEPKRSQILDFCADDPVERVFLEDIARRGMGRFVGLAERNELVALCHLGVNAVPSGRGCGVFADAVVRTAPRMLLGEAAAVGELWQGARSRLARPREDRPGQPVYLLRERPPAGGSGLRPAEPGDLELLLPACAAAHEEELGIDPMRRDAEGFRWRTRAQIEEGRSWLWTENGTILFKAEASAWTPSAVQLQQVWTDPEARRQGFATRGMLDLCRMLLAQVPAVCLFVRSENLPAIRLYETIGMQHVLDYRSVLL
jgi:GNAT superfamily N-acetyltransferase